MKKFGPLMIMAAASLWAIDAIFRTVLTFSIPVSVIVLIEHIIGFIFLSPFLLKDLGALRKLELKSWAVLLLMCLLSSVLGTLLFTQALNDSFAIKDFATPILLQKLQPIFVIILSSIFLKEKVTLKFVFWAIIALIGSYLISFGFNPISLTFSQRELVYLLAIGAAFAWGGGTILSKYLLGKLNFMTASALRFLFAIPFALLSILIFEQTIDISSVGVDQLWRFVVIGGVTGGAFAIYLYYKGLQSTKAKVSTFAELAFPVISILIAVTPLNPYGEAQNLVLGNVVGIILLLVAITKISFDKALAE